MHAFKRPVLPEDLGQSTPSLIHWLKHCLPELSGNAVKKLIETGKIQVDGKTVTHPVTPLKVGQEVACVPQAPRADKQHLQGPKLYHLDSMVVVAEKPTGLLTLPFEEERVALLTEVMRVIPKIEKAGRIFPLRGVHRLDKESSGLVVFARHVKAQQQLQAQFEAHTVERAYLALVHGEVAFDGRVRHQSVLVPDRGDGLKGSAHSPEQIGKHAVTYLEVLERLPGATLLRCELETGRTHQIRIHCAELGHPLVGEPVYIRDFRGKLLDAPRMMLHATTLGFDQPASGERLRFVSPPPALFESVLQRLRKLARSA